MTTSPGSYEISQRFFFDAAHTLDRSVEAEGSRRIHGHTYHAEVALSGRPDRRTGMVMDLGLLRQAIEKLRLKLDHRLLDEVDGLAQPTLENLCAFVWRELAGEAQGLASVRIWRESVGDACTLRA